MADLNWPSTLPQAIERTGYGEQLPDLAIRTPMDAGPDKVRLGAPAGIRELTCSVILTSAQLALFKTFWSDTTRDGALAFNFPHPRTGETIEVYFSEPPQIGAIGGDYWMATFDLETMDPVPPGALLLEAGGALLLEDGTPFYLEA